jgi:serine/threonine protein kinase
MEHIQTPSSPEAMEHIQTPSSPEASAEASSPISVGARSGSGKSPGGRRAYIVTRSLGQGSFGSVFLVSHRQTGAQLVMKEVQLSGLNHLQLLRSRDEVNILRRLNHPHLIAYREAFLEEVLSSLYIVMEYAAGGDLGQLIASRKASGSPCTEPEVLRLLVQCVEALSYCHHVVKLLHRDLKPANIFLTRQGDVKIGDFGISRSLSTSKAVVMTKCGSPLYMAPELCQGLPYGAPADVWSLGVTFYHVCTLTEPWAGQTGAGMMGLFRASECCQMRTHAFPSTQPHAPSDGPCRPLMAAREPSPPYLHSLHARPRLRAAGRAVLSSALLPAGHACRTRAERAPRLPSGRAAAVAARQQGGSDAHPRGALHRGGH